MNFQNENPLISVIVPIYKVEEYIHRCIDSIINQTYKNIEIILVDDGSPDNCGKICEEYAKKDDRITVYHKENGGLSDARNYGIKRANGEYIGFVDSDDYIHPKMYEVLVKNIIKYDADISTCGRSITYDNKIDSKIDFSNFDEILYTNKQAIVDMFVTNNYLHHAAWEKLYRKNLFDNIKFPEGELYEDQAIMYRLMYLSNKIICTKIPLYYWFMREGSITHSKYSQKTIMDEIKHPLEAKSFFENKDNELFYASIYYYLTICLKLYGICSDNNDNELKKQLYKEYKQTYKYLQRSKKRLRLKYKIFYFSPILFKLLNRIKNIKHLGKNGRK